MKNTILILFFLLNIQVLFSQEDNWIQIEDPITHLIGYRDLKGEVKIEPKFTFITYAVIFKNIIPVFEEMNPKDPENSKLKQYYLLKNGKQIGLDSLYVYHTTLDCENENKIRFRDCKTDKVGFFDGNGKIVIPAIYDDAKPFYNGLAVVITQGKRMCWNGSGEFSKENRCEMWSWKGNIQIINDKNEVLIENIPFEKLEALDWFSIQKDKNEINENYIEFKGINGDNYYFLNYEKEFKNWYHQVFLKEVSENTILNFFSEKVTYDGNEILWATSKVGFKESFWRQENKETFFKKNRTFILNRLKLYQKFTTLISEGTNPILFNYENSPQYSSDCGDYQNIKFPYFQVHLLDKNQRVLHSLGFIRIDGKFKLAEID